MATSAKRRAQYQAAGLLAPATIINSPAGYGTGAGGDGTILDTYSGETFGVTQPDYGYSNASPYEGPSSGTTIAAAAYSIPGSPLGGASPVGTVYAGGRTHAVSGKTAGLEAAAAQNQQYLVYGVAFVGIVAAAWLLLRTYKKG